MQQAGNGGLEELHPLQHVDCHTLLLFLISRRVKVEDKDCAGRGRKNLPENNKRKIDDM